MIVSVISSRLESFRTHLKNTEYKRSYIIQFEFEQNCKQEIPIFLDYGFLFFIKFLFLKRIVRLRNFKWKSMFHSLLLFNGY